MYLHFLCSSTGLSICTNTNTTLYSVVLPYSVRTTRTITTLYKTTVLITIAYYKVLIST